MSHFSQIKTQIRDLEALTAALRDLGLPAQGGQEGVDVTIRGHQGQTQTAAIAIPQANGYDVGFRWNGQSYELVADLMYWQQPWSIETFMDKVTQRYAFQAIVKQSAQQGFEVVEQKQAQDGSVKLVLQRWQG